MSLTTLKLELLFQQCCAWLIYKYLINQKKPRHIQLFFLFPPKNILKDQQEDESTAACVRRNKNRHEPDFTFLCRRMLLPDMKRQKKIILICI